MNNITAVELTLRNNVKLIVINLYLAKPEDDETKLSWLRVQEIMERVVEQNKNVVLGGDLNFQVNSDRARSLIQRLGNPIQPT